MMENLGELPHVMVDIETMGSMSYSSIVSIGAVEFEIETGRTGRQFYENVSLQSCLDLGLVINADTLLWWLKQNEEARLEIANAKGVHINIALNRLSQFVSKKQQLWGNSARFDLGILQNAYDKSGMLIPWDFRKERDVRTLVAFKPDIMKSYNHEGVAHNALDDCHKQIGYCSKIWNTLKN
jgi:hypothetical protein